MKQRQNVQLPSVLSVEAINSVYHFNLTGRVAKGELHDFYELVLVEDGFYYVILDGERIVVPPGQCIVFAPNAFHSDDGVTGVTATVSIVSFESASPEMHYFDNRILVPCAEELAQLKQFFAACEEICVRLPGHGGISAKEGTPPFRLQRVKALLELFLLSQYAQKKAKSPSHRKQYRKECFIRVSDYMKSHLNERLTVASIALACGMSESSVKLLCREFCSCGPIDYLIFLRIAAAKRLIRQSGLSLTEIAVQTGFGSLHYFSRVFKAHTGMTPTAYAKAP